MIEGPRPEEAGPNVDPAGAPVEDAGPDPEPATSTPPKSGRVLDRGAIFAGWVGLGMAVVIAMSFELIIAVQALVFIAAPLAGVLIGYYANQRAERFRPRWRLFVNSGYAGLVTGISLALIYVGLRLLFIYADSGYRPEPLGGQIECDTGPACTYARFIDDGSTADLEADGITDAADFESAVWRWQGESVLIITLTTLAGALGAAAVRAVRKPPAPTESEAASPVVASA